MDFDPEKVLKEQAEKDEKERRIKTGSRRIMACTLAFGGLMYIAACHNEANADVPAVFHSLPMEVRLDFVQKWQAAHPLTYAPQDHLGAIVVIICACTLVYQIVRSIYTADI